MNNLTPIATACTVFFHLLVAHANASPCVIELIRDVVEPVSRFRSFTSFQIETLQLAFKQCRKSGEPLFKDVDTSTPCRSN